MNGNRYYVFSILNATKDVVISVSTTAGAVSLYFADNATATSATQPSPSHGYDFISDAAFAQTGTFTITPSMLSPSCLAQIAANRFSGCSLYIGVHGRAPNGGLSSYALVAVALSSPTSFTRLTEYVPVTGNINSSQSLYFKATVNEPALDDLYVTLVPFSGDADLYVNIGVNPAFPNASSYDFASLHFVGADTVVIPSGSAKYCSACTLAITVVGFSSSYFSLTFSSACVTVFHFLVALPSPTPVFGMGRDGTLSLGGTYPTFHIAFVFCCCCCCSFFIVVVWRYGFSNPALPQPSSAPLSQGVTQLLNGLPTPGNVSWGGYTYYRWVVARLPCRVPLLFGDVVTGPCIRLLTVLPPSLSSLSSHSPLYSPPHTHTPPPPPLLSSV